MNAFLGNITDRLGFEPRQIFCIGRNYAEHAKELQNTPLNPAEDRPLLFMKPVSAICLDQDAIWVPRCSVWGPEVDYEGELAVVIGAHPTSRVARNIPESQALEFVHGYCVANDVTARIWQKEKGGGQWIRGKGFDRFCPIGPTLIPREKVRDPQRLRIRTWVTRDAKTELRQDAHTSDMIFPIARLISYISQDTTLLPGTVILTGTPAGVGAGRKPPDFLRPGDTVTVEIEGIGKISNPVTEAPL